MDFYEWVKFGCRSGWCGPPVCSIHDGTPTSESEDEELDSGGDPCVHIMRLYEDANVRDAVERNHPPSRWRKTNAGY